MGNIEQFDNPCPYQLDDFQMNAIDIIKNNTSYNIIITAPTGAGKSLPAEYVIKYNHKIGKRTIFASPVKALSNQKFYDFKQKFKDISLGLITGDYKTNPFADCVIVTTEILLNAINKLNNDSSILDLDLSNVQTVIFDEAHMINDSKRGHVWEQCMIKLNSSISQMLLSATLGNPEQLAMCICTHNNHKTYILVHDKRPVPLEFAAYYTLTNSQQNKLMKVNTSECINRLTPLMNTTHMIFNDANYQQIVNLHTIVEKLKLNTISQITIILNTIKFLTDNNMTPCLFFILSKNKILQLIEHCSSVPLTSSLEQNTIRDKFDFYLRKSNIPREEYEVSNTVQTIKAYAMKGYAYHHSGLLPILKEIVELLYGSNLIKVLFATETFSVGLNMPTKTVVFASLTKYDGKKRQLESSEFIQMAGRAGRRSIDNIGYVIYLPQFDLATTFNRGSSSASNTILSSTNIRSVFTGKPMTIISKYSIDPMYVLKSMFNEINIETEIKTSLWYKQGFLKTEDEKNQLFELQESLKNQKYDLIAEHKNELARYHKLMNDPFKQKNHNKIIQEIKSKINNFDTNYQIWKEINDTEITITRLRHKINEKSSITIEYIQACYEFLFEHNFIDEEYNITQLGKLAIAIGDEGNPFVLATMLNNTDITELSDILFASLLASFCVDKDSEIISKNATLVNAYEICDKINLKYQNSMVNLMLDINSTWEIDQKYIDIAFDWLSGMNLQTICELHQIYEGDFIKNMLKLNKIIERIISVSIDFNIISLAEKMQNIKPLLVRSVISQESIYLTL
jgi:superfamily II RNA helicase